MWKRKAQSETASDGHLLLLRRRELLGGATGVSKPSLSCNRSSGKPKFPSLRLGKLLPPPSPPAPLALAFFPAFGLCILPDDAQGGELPPEAVGGPVAMAESAGSRVGRSLMLRTVRARC